MNNYAKYDEDFKKSLVLLHQNGKSQAHLCKEYGVSRSAISKWVKQYSTVEIDDGEILTANAKHWHGAAKDSWFSHIAFSISDAIASTKWFEKVSDDEYNTLN